MMEAILKAYDSWKSKHPTGNYEQFLKEQMQSDTYDFLKSFPAFRDSKDTRMEFKILDQSYTLFKGKIALLEDDEDEEREDY